MSKPFLFFLPIALLLGAISTTTAFAETPSLNGNGWHDGYAQGHADFLNGVQNNNACNPQNGDAYCAGYELGYGIGWAAAKQLYCGNNPQSSNC